MLRFAFLLLILLAGCGEITQPPPAPAPVTIIAGLDKTLSADSSRVPALGWDDIAGLIDVIRRAGGELALGCITSRSGGLVRLRVEPPPFPPMPPPPGEGTIYERRAAEERYESALRLHKQKQSQWEAEVALKMARFREEAMPLLCERRSHDRTDVHGFLRRALLMAREPDAQGYRNLVYLLLATDGLHDADATPLPAMDGGVEVLVVNGAGELGTLAALDPLRFENFDAALRHILNPYQAVTQ